MTQRPCPCGSVWTVADSTGPSNPVRSHKRARSTPDCEAQSTSTATPTPPGPSVDFIVASIPGMADIAWIVIAFLAGGAARASKMPPLVGYLAAGIGLSVLGVEGSAVVDRIGELGVALLLFVVGLDLRWQSLKQSQVFGAGGLHLLLFATLGVGGGLALGLSPLGAAAVAVSLCTSSLVLAAKTLEARGDRRAFHGRVVIGIILIQTVVATTAITGVGAATPSAWALGLLALPLLRPVLTRVLDVVGRGELLLLFGLALAAGGSLVFTGVGLGAELGALAAGALLAGSDRTDDLRDVLTPVKDALIPAFFLSVGLVGLPGPTGLAVVGLLLVGLLLKAGLFFGVLVGFRMKARTAWLAALPLTTYSGLTLIVGTAAVQAGVLPESALTVLALATAASYLLNAPIARRADVLWDAVKGILQRFERSGENVGFSVAASPATQSVGNARFLVVGLGRSGTAAYDYLEDFLRCPAGLDVDPKRVERQRAAGRTVVLGDARDTSLWEELALDGLDVVLLTPASLSVKLDTIRALRAAGYTGAISALTAHPDHREILNDAGANTVYLSIEQAGRALAAHGLKRRTKEEAPTAVTLDIGPERLAA